MSGELTFCLNSFYLSLEIYMYNQIQCELIGSDIKLGEERANLTALRLFVLSVSSSSWCLGRAAVCDRGTP